MNDRLFTVVRLHGDFMWRIREDSDETFFVCEGESCIDFRDGSLLLHAGEMAVVPKGVERWI